MGWPCGRADLLGRIKSSKQAIVRMNEGGKCSWGELKRELFLAAREHTERKDTEGGIRKAGKQETD